MGCHESERTFRSPESEVLLVLLLVVAHELGFLEQMFGTVMKVSFTFLYVTEKDPVQLVFISPWRPQRPITPSGLLHAS